MRQAPIDSRSIRRLICLVASVLPSVLSSQTIPGPVAAVPFQSGQAQSVPSSPADSASATHFHDMSAQAGLNTVPHSSSERRYIVETMGGGGVALLDCDNDGRLDIAVVNDSPIDRFLAGDDPMITLYRQDGSGANLHFTDFTAAAGLTTRGWGMAIAVGDYD